MAFSDAGSTATLGSFERVDAAYPDRADDMTPESCGPADDPIFLLEKHLGDVVAVFSEGDQIIRASMEQDQLNAQSLAKMEEDLRALGNNDAANRLVEHSKNALNHSLKQVVPMRRHIEEIAGLLNEAMDPEIQTDAASLTQILGDVQDESRAAREIAAAGKEKFELLAGQLQKIREEYQLITEEAKEQARQYQEQAEEHKKTAAALKSRSNRSAVVSALSGTVSLGGSLGGAGIGIAGAEAAAALGIPGLTTSSGIIMTTISFNPVALAVGSGLAAAFGLVAIGCAVVARRASNQREEAEGNKKTSEMQAEESEAMVQRATETEEVAQTMVAESKKHKDLWDGLTQSAEQAAHTFSTLKKLDPTGARRKKFAQKMKAYAEDLLHFVKAIDHYLFWLHAQGFFPPTFSIENAMGRERFAKVKKEYQAAVAANRRGCEDCEPAANQAADQQESEAGNEAAEGQD
eukprot:Skav231053  [mRNA]  locus=scaffold2842:79891:82724:+ [translate_table: standard]